MIGVVIVTHGRLASEFLAAAEHIAGPQKGLRAVDIGPDDDLNERRRDILQAVKSCDSGSGVAVLTDMFGGTPSNLSISIMGKGQIEVIAGVNLPMVIKLIEIRDKEPLNRAVQMAQEAARKYVAVASAILASPP